MLVRDCLQNLLAYLRTPPTVQAAREKEELREEIEFHLLSSVEDSVAGGTDEAQSRQNAMQRFGDVTWVCSRVLRNSVSTSTVLAPGPPDSHLGFVAADRWMAAGNRFSAT